MTDMTDREVGVGPHPEPWPDDDRYDPEFLKDGDRRNVEDRFRYWRVEAIRDELIRTASPLEVAIENWQHDRNIGTIVRTANAFNVRRVHVIGRRHWNRRGAMVTDRYMEVIHHETVAEFAAAVDGAAIVAVDNLPGAKDVGAVTLPLRTVLVFGGEGPGVSQEMLAATDEMVMISQFGSTRSLNVGVAAGIVLYEYSKQHPRDSM